MTAIRKRLDPVQRSESILEQAFKLFSERHYSSVTMRDIAECCGINVSLIYHYFDSREHLLEAVLDHAIERLIGDYRALGAEQATPWRAVESWLDLHVEDAAIVMPMVKILADHMGKRGENAAVDAAVDKLFRNERAFLEAALRRGVDAGDFAPVDAAQMARFIGLHLDGIFHGSASRGEARIAGDIGDLKDMVRRLLQPRSYPGPATAQPERRAGTQE